MNRNLMILSVFLSVSLIDTVSPQLSFANDVDLVYKDEKGASLTSGSVLISKADVAIDGGNLRITGRLKRPHKLKMPGHLHAFIYSTDGTLLVDGRHSVSGLSSTRNGMMQVLFHILVQGYPPEGAKVVLSYHGAGHSEG